ncbi:MULTISPECIES: type IV pilus twitching motility protein PilT [unclassified Cryobacterium]|uniref:type IV pilus twitching motility protein PilT n=1 Tax=unclassified Cryobacterium TaxID=2649013 RepID=UPI00106B711C|nr:MULTISPECIES: PilT/PilU family type 4a pilus ATPase [unclassified Cryobacterium]TFC56939.1 PilT/PilU family type 4a pilus ATPase [Cryobacterium sp. TMB3-1-2]TFC67896.1 PilT/PilU family type 4a pilus ATPase [Cryobacterium sp. TMB3-15]TFC76815.1 PilT/PilU family type 4a pilus ATPase [Cryobacterium sp. TMB3-10]TFD42232.1 PilT/PilU family type 4a pilus ATPase [Cryobacterium sp. TMB3-12]
MSQPIYEIPVTPPQRPQSGDDPDADPAATALPEAPLPWYLQDPADSPPTEPVVFKSIYDQPTDTVTAYPTHAEPARTEADIQVIPEQARPDLTRSALDPASNEVLRPRTDAPAGTATARPRRAQRFEDVVEADQDILNALQEVLDLDGSDLHVTVGAPPSIRVNGSLRPLDNTNRWMREKVQSALYSLLSPAQREEFERELELDFAYTTNGARFRVNYYQQRNSIGGAFRLIPREIKQLKDLGVPESVGRFAAMARGLVLVTGPTGSGKSTTLAALVDQVNRTRADHIVTVEDPIEFLHRHQKSLVNQREVGSDTHSFAAALKHVLRQDPDVILIGELRDLETISVALTAAETGHLVFATLHTQSAAQTIDRIIDVFPPHQQSQVRSQLAATLQGVVCQTLVKRVDGGRVVATEVLFATSAIANLIREGKTYQISSAMQAGREQGMHSMDQHLADLVNTGLITRKSAEEKAQDVTSLGQLIRRSEFEEPISLATDGPDYDAYAPGN